MNKKYKLGLDIRGLGLFLLIMLPNIIWFVIPAPNDVLRNKSVTPVIDTIGSVFQMIFIITLCTLKRVEVNRIKLSKLIIGMFVMLACYYVGWIIYYCGIVNPIVNLVLAIAPCSAFILYVIDRKNVPALISVTIFTVCHVIFAVMNFMV